MAICGLPLTSASRAAIVFKKSELVFEFKPYLSNVLESRKCGPASLLFISGQSPTAFVDGFGDCLPFCANLIIFGLIIWGIPARQNTGRSFRITEKLIDRLFVFLVLQKPSVIECSFNHLRVL
jgi:hypothetical protein